MIELVLAVGKFTSSQFDALASGLRHQGITAPIARCQKELTKLLADMHVRVVESAATNDKCSSKAVFARCIDCELPESFALVVTESEESALTDFKSSFPGLFSDIPVFVVRNEVTYWLDGS